MKPYYEQDGITIYHGDCLEMSLPEGIDVSGDLVVPSPPYGIGRDAGRQQAAAIYVNRMHPGLLAGVRWRAAMTTTMHSLSGAPCG